VSETKDSNPKEAIGSAKLMVHLVPSTAVAYMALAFTEGAAKYGKYNWRYAGVRYSTYLDAMHRHLMKLQNGENVDGVTGVPHLASIMACAAIICDSFHYGKLNDDRPYIGVDVNAANIGGGGFSSLLDNDLAAISNKVKDVFKSHTPIQYVITWAPPVPPAPKPEPMQQRQPPRTATLQDLLQDPLAE
jgi:hypothetical protein